MEKASMDLNYEKAAIYRDRISALRDIQRAQSVAGFRKSRDAIYLTSLNGVVKIGVTHVNDGWVTGHENFLLNKDFLAGNLLEEFLKALEKIF